MSKASVYDWHLFKRFMRFIAFFSLGLGLSALVYRSLIVSVAISLIFTYILSPAVSKLSYSGKVGRNWIVLGVSILFFGGFISGAAAIVPTIYTELVEILKQIPRAVVYVNQKIIPIRDFMVSRGFISYEAFDKIILDLDLMRKVTTTTTDAIQKVWSSTPQVLGGALNTVLIPLMTWFFLNNMSNIRLFIQSIVPKDIQSLAQYNIRKMDIILWGVVKGQLLVALILSFLYMFGFSVIGLQSGIAIGAVAGICRIVPYLDVLVGSMLSVVVIIGQGGSLGMVMAVAVVITLVQLLDGMIVTPRIIGDRAGIHPVVVIASVIAFGDWFGILGIILAVPTVAIIVSGLQMALPYYRNSPFFKGETE
ncbi:AI-2E family transporter [Pseudobacteriovorax antillogorgiicola]|uniref:Predicted PurR-regulated permease PerM n=1 Tax=Pseudobacteriovorax antillogorgiicola TaxID=1513793 RepID=A0A1Y6B6X8_9BACT|nr:AI-2E family transporter [Pseudobacteriovorax antillogorgiicola]TCS59543.1 putative PurR-regulated permease PerM [Pseudobacteriovorax antillogorgiicola]SME87773.1 Predicted PurR-regulated permease PerM [Pseudobacteriovorax antillogorgiicola]